MRPRALLSRNWDSPVRQANIAHLRIVFWPGNASSARVAKPFRRGRLTSRTGCAEFFHRNAIAALIVFHTAHIGFDQSQPTAAAAF